MLCHKQAPNRVSGRAGGRGGPRAGVPPRGAGHELLARAQKRRVDAVVLAPVVQRLKGLDRVVGRREGKGLISGRTQTNEGRGGGRESCPSWDKQPEKQHGTRRTFSRVSMRTVSTTRVTLMTALRTWSSLISSSSRTVWRANCQRRPHTHTIAHVHGPGRCSAGGGWRRCRAPRGGGPARGAACARRRGTRV